MPPLEIHPFTPAPDTYAALTALWNALNPHWPRAAGPWARFDAADFGDGPVARVLAYRGDQLVGVADSAPGSPGDGGDRQVSVFARPDGAGAAVLRMLWDALEAAFPEVRREGLRAYVADNRPWDVRFFASKGFEVVQRTAFSTLDVLRFEAERFVPLLERLGAEGVEIRSVADLESEGLAWRRPYWELDAEIIHDVPVAGGMEVEPYDTFCAFLDNRDRFQPEASFVAMRGDADEVTMLGTSRLLVPPATPHWSLANLTGVRRDARRGGLATALKLATIAYAVDMGVPSITALNDESNPMLALNRTLGFETQYIQLSMRRDRA